MTQTVSIVRICPDFFGSYIIFSTIRLLSYYMYTVNELSMSYIRKAEHLGSLSETKDFTALTVILELECSMLHVSHVSMLTIAVTNNLICNTYIKQTEITKANVSIHNGVSNI